MNTKHGYWHRNKFHLCLFAVALFAQRISAEPAVPSSSAHINPQIINIRPVTAFERLQIMAQMPLVHYCVVGIVSGVIIYWPFSWPNGGERIRYYLNLDHSCLKETKPNE